MYICIYKYRYGCTLYGQVVILHVCQDSIPKMCKFITVQITLRLLLLLLPSARLDSNDRACNVPVTTNPFLIIKTLYIN